jgi:hypothetical protein
MLAALPLTGFAAEDNATMAADTAITARETDAPDAAEVVPMPMPAFPVVNQNEPEYAYAYVEGTITEINDYGEDGKQIIRIAKNENEWDVVTDSGTYYITSGKTNRKAMGVDNSEKLESPGAFMNESGIIMVPVRAVAESMGLHVEWYGDTKTVQIGKSLSFTIGKDSYAYNRMFPISLGTAPILKESRTYVPIDFFCGSFENLSVDYRCDGNINIIYDKTE